MEEAARRSLAGSLALHESEASAPNGLSVRKRSVSNKWFICAKAKRQQQSEEPVAEIASSNIYKWLINTTVISFPFQGSLNNQHLIQLQFTYNLSHYF